MILNLFLFKVAHRGLFSNLTEEKRSIANTKGPKRIIFEIHFSMDAKNYNRP